MLPAHPGLEWCFSPFLPGTHRSGSSCILGAPPPVPHGNTCVCSNRLSWNVILLCLCLSPSPKSNCCKLSLLVFPAPPLPCLPSPALMPGCTRVIRVLRTSYLRPHIKQCHPPLDTADSYHTRRRPPECGHCPVLKQTQGLLAGLCGRALRWTGGSVLQTVLPLCCALSRVQYSHTRPNRQSSPPGCHTSKSAPKMNSL